MTGAASGIGKATAQRLAAEGAKVALADVNEPELAKVADAICAGGDQALALRLDVTSEADWQSAYRVFRPKADCKSRSAGLERGLTSAETRGLRRMLIRRYEGLAGIRP